MYVCNVYIYVCVCVTLVTFYLISHGKKSHHWPLLYDCCWDPSWPGWYSLDQLTSCWSGAHAWHWRTGLGGLCPVGWRRAWWCQVPTPGSPPWSGWSYQTGQSSPRRNGIPGGSWWQCWTRPRPRPAAIEPATESAPLYSERKNFKLVILRFVFFLMHLRSFEKEFDFKNNVVQCFSKIIKMFLSATSTETKFIQHTSGKTLAPTHSRSSSDMSPRVHTAWCVNRSKDLSCCLSYIILFLKRWLFYRHSFRIPKGLSSSLCFLVCLRRRTVKIRQHPQRPKSADTVHHYITSKTELGFFFCHFKNIKSLYASCEFINNINYIGIKLFY